MCLVWVMGALVLLLLWGRREGMTSAPEIAMPNLASPVSGPALNENKPIGYLYASPMLMQAPGPPGSGFRPVPAKDCNECIGGKNFWNPSSNHCSSIPATGFFETCAQPT
jgi:hypothetical protein